MDPSDRDPGSYAELLESPSRAWKGQARRARTRRVAAATGIAALVLVAAGVAFAAWSPFRSATSAPPTAPSVQTPSGVTLASAADTMPAAATTPSGSVEPTASEEVVIGWVGDITPGSKYGNPPDNGRALFASTRKYTTKPDLMVGNLEGTFGVGGRSKCSKEATDCYAFQAPPKNAAALKWAGFDVVNLANNHSNDYLAAGAKSTRAALEDNGIAYTGLDGTVAIQEVNGVKVAFLGFAPYPWSDNIGDIPQAKKIVKSAAGKADVVVVLMHAGAEGADKTRTPKGAERAYGEFRGDARRFSHAVIDAGADVVLGSGPHVVRGMEEYKGRLIAYSLGNFAGWRNFSRNGKLALSGLLTVRVAKDGSVQGGKWQSIRIASPGVPKQDSGKESLALVRKLSKRDFDSPVQLDDSGEFTFQTE